MAASHFSGPVYSKNGFVGGVNNQTALFASDYNGSDCRAAVNTALKGGNVTVRFTPGTYNLTGDLAIYSNTHIIVDEGAVVNCTTSRWTGFMANNVYIEINGQVNALLYTGYCANVQLGDWPYYLASSVVGVGHGSGTTLIMDSYSRGGPLAVDMYVNGTGIPYNTKVQTVNGGGSFTVTNTISVPAGTTIQNYAPWFTTNQALRGFIELGGTNTSPSNHLYVYGTGIVTGDWVKPAGWPVTPNPFVPGGNFGRIGIPNIWDSGSYKGIAFFNSNVCRAIELEVVGFAVEAVYYDGAIGYDILFDRIVSHDHNMNALNFNVGAGASKLKMQDCIAYNALQCVELSQGELTGCTLTNSANHSVVTGWGYVGAVNIHDNLIGEPDWVDGNPVNVSADASTMADANVAVADNIFLCKNSDAHYNTPIVTTNIPVFAGSNNVVMGNGKSKIIGSGTNDCVYSNGNTTKQLTYKGSTTSFYTNVVDLSTLLTDINSAGKIKVYGNENTISSTANANTSYCEYYLLKYYATNPPPPGVTVGLNYSLSAIGTKLTTGTAYGNVDVQVSGNYLQVKNEATAATVTFTGGNPGVVNYANSNYSAGFAVAFTTTGTLPTGITANTIYYVAASPAPTSGTFSIATTNGGAAIQFTGSGTGTHYINIFIARYAISFELVTS